MNSIQTDCHSVKTHSATLPQIHTPLECLSGKVFLYPKRAVWTDAPSKEGRDAIRMGDYPELFKNKGKFVLCLEVWVTNSECNNWACHNWEKLDGRFPDCLPITYFLGKKEGDTVEIECNEKAKKFSLLCQQKGSKYEEDNPSFDGMMEEMFMVTYNKLSDKYEEGILTEEEHCHWEIISALKNEHYPNSTITNRGFGSNCKVQ